MALGLGKMFGFELVENFNYPYISSNIKEFWKRWHITLSSFFKEYVYIPLGGSKCSKTRTIFNLFVVWFLTGFWHGADWNFICWGLYFFVLLLIEKFLVSKLEIKKWMKPFRHIITLFLLGVSFIIFGASNMSNIFVTIQHLFAGMLFDNNTWFELRNNMVLLIISMIGATPLIKNIYAKLKDTKYGCIVEPIYIICILMLSTAYLIDGSYNPFLYFRF
jgi:alginate O-acetyltransferase complex protein AlgI